MCIHIIRSRRLSSWRISHVWKRPHRGRAMNATYSPFKRHGVSKTIIFVSWTILFLRMLSTKDQVLYRRAVVPARTQVRMEKHAANGRRRGRLPRIPFSVFVFSHQDPRLKVPSKVRHLSSCHTICSLVPPIISTAIVLFTRYYCYLSLYYIII